MYQQQNAITNEAKTNAKCKNCDLYCVLYVSVISAAAHVAYSALLKQCTAG